jgi:hypothetical protein
MRRHAIGVLALALLLAAIATCIWAPGEASSYFLSSCVRVGALLGVLWLAYADLRRIPPWLWVVFLPLLAVLVIKPKWALYLAPIILILAILHPRIWPSSRKPRIP